VLVLVPVASKAFSKIVETFLWASPARYIFDVAVSTCLAAWGIGGIICLLFAAIGILLHRSWSITAARIYLLLSIPSISLIPLGICLLKVTGFAQKRESYGNPASISTSDL
jgi:hypothetical protein